MNTNKRKQSFSNTPRIYLARGARAIIILNFESSQRNSSSVPVGTVDDDDGKLIKKKEKYRRKTSKRRTEGGSENSLWCRETCRHLWRRKSLTDIKNRSSRWVYIPPWNRKLSGFERSHIRGIELRQAALFRVYFVRIVLVESID